MEAQNVETFKDFIAFGRHFAKDVPIKRQGSYEDMMTLEHYLRSLWAVCLFHSQKNLTWSLFAQLLQEALITSPAPVNPAWNHNKSPDLSEKRPDFEHLRVMITYQIADLHLINGALGTDDPQEQ